MSSPQGRQTFWSEATAVSGSVTSRVIPKVIGFGLIAGLICGGAWITRRMFEFRLGLEDIPLEYAGTGLGILLVIRTSAGYDRWWEGRKLWGGIVNQSRNFVISALAYGPKDAAWRRQLVRWTAAFPHVARLNLLGERLAGEVTGIVGQDATSQLQAVDHMPSYVVLKLADLLRQACEGLAMDRFSFQQLDHQRTLLLDYVGACERIRSTPLPRIYSITIRRFVLLFLLMLPLALLDRLTEVWLVPFVTMLIAYPLLSLDQIGVELENPFSTANLSHLPIDTLAASIERNALGVFAIELPPDSEPAR